jgi:hypothetical protein
MEDDVIVVSRFGVGNEVLHGFGSSFREETNVDVAVGSADDGGCTRRSRFSFDLLLGINVTRLLVLDVSLGFRYTEKVSDVGPNMSMVAYFESFVNM